MLKKGSEHKSSEMIISSLDIKNLTGPAAINRYLTGQ